MGATEPHNLHLPYGTDTLQAEAIGSRVCEAAWHSGAKVVMLPAIPYDTETNQAKCRLSINVNPTTLGIIIRDIVVEGGVTLTVDTVSYYLGLEPEDPLEIEYVIDGYRRLWDSGLFEDVVIEVEDHSDGTVTRHRDRSHSNAAWKR